MDQKIECAILKTFFNSRWRGELSVEHHRSWTHLRSFMPSGLPSSIIDIALSRISAILCQPDRADQGPTIQSPPDIFRNDNNGLMMRVISSSERSPWEEDRCQTAGPDAQSGQCIAISSWTVVKMSDHRRLVYLRRVRQMESSAVAFDARWPDKEFPRNHRFPADDT
jgi:hypothetical protein